MSERSRFLLDFFGDRFILLKEEWLNAAIQFLHNNIPAANNINDEKFANLIFEQWKCSDFSLTSFSVFANHGIEASTSRKTILGPIVCQINSLIDIGTPFYAQYCKLSNKVKEDNSGFEKLFHDNSEDTDKKTCRMLKLSLSDGEIFLSAIEFKRCPQLSLYIKPGCKILILPPVKLKRGTFLLEPTNCQVLGGECLPLLNNQRPLDRYQELLKIKETNETQKVETKSTTSSLRTNKSSQPRLESSNGEYSQAKNNPINTPSSSQKLFKENYDDFDDVVEDSMTPPFLDSPISTVTVSSLTSRLVTEFIEDHEKEDYASARKALNTSINTSKPCGMLTTKRINSKDEELENRIEEDEEPISYKNQFVPITIRKRKCVKIEDDDDDDDIQVIELETPSPSNIEEKEKKAKNELSKEEKNALIEYSKIKLNKIQECVRKMKYCVGSRKFMIMAILNEIVEPLRIQDNLWTIKVSMKDEISSCQALIDNPTLEQLIGFTCQQAIEIRKSSDMEKRKDGKKRLEALENQIQRLDLVFEVEFFNDSTVSPVIRSIKTMAELLDAY